MTSNPALGVLHNLRSRQFVAHLNICGVGFSGCWLPWRPGDCVWRLRLRVQSDVEWMIQITEKTGNEVEKSKSYTHTADSLKSSHWKMLLGSESQNGIKLLEQKYYRPYSKVTAVNVKRENEPLISSSRPKLMGQSCNRLVVLRHLESDRIAVDVGW